MLRRWFADSLATKLGSGIVGLVYGLPLVNAPSTADRVFRVLRTRGSETQLSSLSPWALSHEFRVPELVEPRSNGNSPLNRRG